MCRAPFGADAPAIEIASTSSADGPFHPRCPLYAAKGKPAECRSTMPELVALKSQPDHVVRCHFAEE